jgi:hypothetical protein
MFSELQMTRQRLAQMESDRNHWRDQVNEMHDQVTAANQRAEAGQRLIDLIREIASAS